MAWSRVGQSYQIRAVLLERGVAVRQGLRFLRAELPTTLATRSDVLSSRITKRGNRYLRTLFMQGARVILLRPANWAKHSFGPWLTAAAQRLHHNVLATALANKLARIALTVLVKGRGYETRVTSQAA